MSIDVVHGITVVLNGCKRMLAACRRKFLKLCTLYAKVRDVIA